jgi:glutathione S-transferase
MDSRAIAPALEAAHPSPPLRLDDPAVAAVEARANAARVPAMSALYSVTIPRVPRNVLGEGSLAYFHRTREAWLGKPLDEFQAKGEREEEAWEKARAGFVELAGVLRETEGPFLMGREREFLSAPWRGCLADGAACYADFTCVSSLQFLRAIDEGIFQRVVGFDVALKAQYGACEKWLERGD